MTCSDSGGVLEFVVDGTTGLVMEPDPREIAEAFDCLFLDREKAKALGSSARDRVQELKIDWDHVVGRLLS